MILVSGEAGVGKSRLVTEVLSEWDGHRITATASPGSSAYALLVNVLEGAAPGTSQASAASRPDQAHAIIEAIGTLSRTEPTAVVLDDLHLADAASVDLLPEIAAALESAPMLVLGIYRSDDLPRTHALRGMRAELRRAGRLVDVALRPLSEPQTRELLADLLGTSPSPTLVSAVHLRTEGLPFFIEEMAAALVDGDDLMLSPEGVSLGAKVPLPLPESVVDAVLVRTHDLREQYGSATEYAAALGVRVDLAALSGLIDVADVDPLLEAGLLIESEGGIAVFRHALVREALYRSIPWTRRRSHHRQIAELLTARGAAPAVIAEHWLRGGAPEAARPLLLTAAEQHCRAHAYRDATELLRKAVENWTAGDDAVGRLQALEKLADCQELSGDLKAAAQTWAEVASNHRDMGDLSRSGAAHRRVANADELLGDLIGATASRVAAAEMFTSAGRRGEAATEHLILAENLKAAGRLSIALEHAEAATANAEASQRRDVQARALGLQGAVRSALGDGRRGVELARAGLELALTEQLHETAGAAYYELAEALEYAADYARAVDAYESAFELCRTEGLDDLAQTCFACMSPVVRLMGDWDRTLAICAEVLQDEDASELVRRVAEEESGLIHALRGDVRRARGPLRRAATFGSANGIIGLEVGGVWGLALVAELEQDEALMLGNVALLVDRTRATEECHYSLPPLRWAASLLAERGDTVGVAACHRAVAAQATRNGSAKVLSALAHVGAELAMVEDDFEQAGALFARSLDLLVGMTAPYEQSHTGLRWGQAQAAAGEREAAVTTVTSAYRTARRLGARPLAAKSAAVLADMGEQVDRRLGRLAVRAMAPAGLTRREQEVLRHLAAGKSNRQIATELFLSTRTVEMHVRNVLAKLDCTSRTAAVMKASESGLLAMET